MKQNNSLPASLRGENYAIIAQGKHACIYPGELVQTATLEEMKALQTPGKVVTFLAPSRLMQEAGRAAIGDEPIFALVSHIRDVQYYTRDKLLRLLKQHGDGTFSLGASTPNIGDDMYAEKVRDIQGYIRSGDICQAVLARHFVSPVTGMNPEKTPLAMLHHLLMIRGTYMTALFRTPGASYLYASPERHLTIQDGRATTNPIAGTMKIGDPDTFQSRLEQFAFQNEKEAKELAMLLDEGTKIIAEFCPHGEIE
jgi:phenazine biosynthesis protein phzE